MNKHSTLHTRQHATTDVCDVCNDEPYHPSCPKCRSVPIARLHAMCREPLRQLAKDMCAKPMCADCLTARPLDDDGLCVNCSEQTGVWL